LIISIVSLIIFILVVKFILPKFAYNSFRKLTTNPENSLLNNANSNFKNSWKNSFNLTSEKKIKSKAKTTKQPRFKFLKEIKKKLNNFEYISKLASNNDGIHHKSYSEGSGLSALHDSDQSLEFSFTKSFDEANNNIDNNSNNKNVNIYQSNNLNNGSKNNNEINSSHNDNNNSFLSIRSSKAKEIKEDEKNFYYDKYFNQSCSMQLIEESINESFSDSRSTILVIKEKCSKV